MAEHEAAPKVYLREVSDDDLPIFFKQQLDQEANYMAAFTSGNPSDRGAFDAHWAKIRANSENVIRTIVADGSVAGYVASYVDAEFGKREVTYWIGKDHWGKGVATRALRDYLSVVDERPIYGRAARDNLASIRVLEKCGFTIIGYDKGFANARGAEIEEAILERA